MGFVDERTEIFQDTIDEWLLSAACDHANLYVVVVYLLHQFQNTRHDWCLR
jgi:hypothetical protein